MADDLSSASRAPRGVDLVAGRAGVFNRGQAGYVPQSTTQAATFTTPWVEMAGHSNLRLDVIVAAVVGAGGTVTVAVQTSFDAGVTDAAAQVGAASPAIAAAGTTRMRPGPTDRWVRALVTLAGATSATLSLSGEAI